MPTVDHDVYRPIILAIEDALRSELPLLDGHVVSALAEKALDAVGETGALNDPYVCAVGYCRDDAVWGTDRCPTHTKDDDA